MAELGRGQWREVNGDKQEEGREEGDLEVEVGEERQDVRRGWG